MTLFSRYIFRQIATATLLTAGALTFIVWLTQSLKLIEFVVEGGVGAALFGRMLMLTVPTLLPPVLPAALVAGILFTYWRMASDSELTALRAAGVSSLRLAAPGLALGGLVAAALVALNFHFAPAARGELAQIKTLARSEVANLLLRPGIFTPLGPDATVYVESQDAEGRLRGIVYHDASDRDAPVSVFANEGVLSLEDETPKVVAFNGSRQKIDLTTGKMSVLHFDSYAVDLEELRPSDPGTARRPRDKERTLFELFDEAGRDPAVWTEIHRRFAGPLVAPAFAALALSVLLVGEAGRRGGAGKIIFAVSLAVALQGVALGLSNAAGKSAAALAGLYFLPMAAIGAGVARLALAGRVRPTRRRGTEAAQ